MNTDASDAPEQVIAALMAKIARLEGGKRQPRKPRRKETSNIYRRPNRPGGRYHFRGTINGGFYRTALRPPGSGLATKIYREAKKLADAFIALAMAGKAAVHIEGHAMRLFAACDAYIVGRRADHAAPKSIQTDLERLAPVRLYFGDCRLKEITRVKIDAFKLARSAGTAPFTRAVGVTTLNKDIGALRKVMTRYKQWARLKEDGVKNVKPDISDDDEIIEVGRALTDEEQAHLLATAEANPDLRWQIAWAFTEFSVMSGMRGGEVKKIRLKDTGALRRNLRVRGSKTAAARRTIWVNDRAMAALDRVVAIMAKKGFTDPDHYLFCAGEHHHYDPTRPRTTFRTVWRSLTKTAGLKGLRMHDLRHTVITRLMEQGIADEVVMSLVGHISRKMLEHYSHVRLAAKQKAMEGLV